MRRLLDHDVRVGPDETKGADAGRSRAVSVRTGRPGNALDGNHQREPLPGHVRRWLVEMQVGRNLLVPKRQDYFNKTGDPCSGLQMPDIRLDRSDHQRVTGFAS